jgi:hypothetical protein
MLKYKFRIFLFLILFVHLLNTRSQTVITSISAEYQNGQVFLTWNEANVTDSTRFNVYLSNEPISESTISDATLVGHHIEPSSACDWWLNPASFSVSEPEDKSHGFQLANKTLDPSSGLFVHTVLPQDSLPMYFAVTYTVGKVEFDSVTAGENSLITPASGPVSLPLPVPQADIPLPGTSKGKFLIFKLHGRGSDVSISNNANFLVFGDSSQGWREGLARKFYVKETEESIEITPYDRIWIGRPLIYSWDKRDHVPAINTFWHGCNNKIYDKNLVNEGVMVDYTENFILYLVEWAQSYYETDPERTYLEGTSMGGAGGISLGFHHPDVFARIKSNVPIVAYTDKAGSDGRSSLKRLDGICGRPADETIYTYDGIRFIDYMNEEKIVREYGGELPFLLLTNGRNDLSIPWINNPSFYKALDERNRGYTCYWNDGDHDMHVDLPSDFVNLYTTLPIFKKNVSFPAFSNFSNNKNPGNGEKTNGDITGWMNRGIYWTEVTETENYWVVKLHTEGDFITYPTSVDVTPRNLQLFQVEKGETYFAEHNSYEEMIQADDNGFITVKGVSFYSKLDVIYLRIGKTSTKIGHVSKKDHLYIYPNPVSGSLYIDTSEFRTPSSTISIFTNTGTLIYKNPIRDDLTIIDTRTFKEGIYMVRTENNKKFSVSRFIVTH